MFQNRELGLFQAYQVGATALISVLFWVYFLVLNNLVPGFGLAGAASYFEYYLALVLGFQISFIRGRQNDIFSLSLGMVESHRFVWPHMMFALGITCIFLVLTNSIDISRLFLFTFIPIAYIVLLIVSRYFALDWLQKIVRHHQQEILLVGKPEEVLNIAPLLEKAKLFGFEVRGIVTDSPQEEVPMDIVRLGAPDDLPAVVERHGIRNILILGSPRDRRMLGDWMRMAEAHGCRVSLVNDLDVFLQRRLSYFRCNNIDLIELRKEPLQNPVNRAIKRAMDLVAGLFGVCVVLPPLMLVVWIAQRLQAPGPLFFHQQRSGLDNQGFVIAKFRTMYAEQCDSDRQVTTHDSRVYPLGRILRRLSLDEFPQLINVFQGSMSLVGPRPHIPRHDQIFAEKMSTYPVRSFVKPGVTGLAQIRGYRGEMTSPEDIVKRVECDIEYIEQWSPALDVRIVWRTVISVFRPPKSAY